MAACGSSVPLHHPSSSALEDFDSFSLGRAHMCFFPQLFAKWRSGREEGRVGTAYGCADSNNGMWVRLKTRPARFMQVATVEEKKRLMAGEGEGAELSAPGILWLWPM